LRTIVFSCVEGASCSLVVVAGKMPALQSIIFILTDYYP
jgi:hypothetical protein